MKYLLVNPKTNNSNGLTQVEELKKKLTEEYSTVDVTLESFNYAKFMADLKENDTVVLCGGDGTLNFFINHVELESIKNDVYLYPTGTGNDFLKDIDKLDTKEPVQINKYLHNLPTVEVNGKTMKFINGVGYGIDGYCCEVADKMKEKSDKPINYTSIAIKGLLFHFKKRVSTFIIDGKEYSFKNVWLTPTMKGRCYGGGMIVAPNQDRLNENNDLSVVVYKTKSKIKALMVFPSIFKGEHIKHEKVVQIFTGKDIEVSFDIPCALQVDGETILNVKSYKVHY